MPAPTFKLTDRTTKGVTTVALKFAKPAAVVDKTTGAPVANVEYRAVEVKIADTGRSEFRVSMRGGGSSERRHTTVDTRRALDFHARAWVERKFRTAA